MYSCFFGFIPRRPKRKPKIHIKSPAGSMSTGVIFILDKGVSPILASGVRSTLAPGVIRAWVFQSDKEYIIGHNNYRDPQDAYNDESQMLYLQQTWSKIIEWMNGLIKGSASIIHQNLDFFNSLSDIEQVVVYGHSFYEVDWPYMEEIVKHIGIDKPWAISYHVPEDLKRIDSFVKKKGLKKVREFKW